MSRLSSKYEHPPERPAPPQDGPDRELASGIICAAALVAWSDGRADPTERRHLLGVFHQHGLAERYGRRDVLAAFNNTMADLRVRQFEAFQAAVSQLDRLAGTPHAGPIAAAARRIALADGVIWPQEAAMLQIVQDRLGLGRSRPGAVPANP